MSSPFLTIVGRDDPGDGQLLPRWAGGSDVVAEPADGPGATFPVPGLMSGHLDSGVQVEYRLSGLSGRARVTGSRVVVVCRRFEAKGGGWVGWGWGAAFAIVANVVSKARVAARGAGKAAVGQIRYEQLAFVGWRSKADGNSANEVRLGFRRIGEPTGVLDLQVPGDLDPSLVAVEIIRSAARHLLATGSATAPELVELADSGPPPATSTGFAMVRFPDPALPVAAVPGGPA